MTPTQDVTPLVEALERAAPWFEEYAHNHKIKALYDEQCETQRAARLDKSKRNKERVQSLRQAVAKWKAQDDE